MKQKYSTAKEAPSGADHSDELLHLSLDGLLAADQTLVLNRAMRTVSLLTSTAEGEAQVLSQQRFTPNGMRVLLPLLRAYPGHCPYEVLMASLFSISPDQARQQLEDSWEVAMRPVRRAIASLTDGLRALGIHVRALHRTGYVLTSLP